MMAASTKQQWEGEKEMHILERYLGSKIGTVSSNLNKDCEKEGSLRMTVRFQACVTMDSLKQKLYYLKLAMLQMTRFEG